MNRDSSDVRPGWARGVSLWLGIVLMAACAWPGFVQAQDAAAPPPVAAAAVTEEGADPAAPAAAPQEEEKAGTEMTIYGHAMLDIGYQTGQSDPDWFDVLRPTKLPSYEGQYGSDGNFFAGVRQSRLGVRTTTPTSLGDLKTLFEFELFGTGADAGQTTFRLRHAYGELGQFGAGQTWSPFMDIDVFPNSIEYWGPNAMVFFRNVQLRWMPIQGDTRLTFAIERPGASADQGIYSDRIELDGISARFPLPDFSGEFRWGQEWGYLEIAGMLRRIEWDDNLEDQFNLAGEATGWGLNLSTNIHIAEHVFRGQFVFGEGIQNYMNDAPSDIGIVNNFRNPVRPIEGKPLPMWGLVAFLDLNWSEDLTSTLGYSILEIDNTDGQAPDAFKRGEYALANVLFHPLDNLFFGPEIQWGRRTNNTDGFSSDDVRVQFSIKYNFASTFGIGGN